MTAIDKEIQMTTEINHLRMDVVMWTLGWDWIGCAFMDISGWGEVTRWGIEHPKVLIKLKLLTLFLHLHHLFHWTGGAVGLGQPTLVINKGGAATAALLSKAPAHPQIRHVRKMLLWANGNILKFCGYKRLIQKKTKTFCRTEHFQNLPLESTIIILKTFLSKAQLLFSEPSFWKHNYYCYIDIFPFQPVTLSSFFTFWFW